jgi:HD-GYP domain-containing protein (c-di-GMP phosphodiesterase class II)
VDALDAMTDDRPYRSATSWDEALTELLRCRGTQFDPDVIDAIGICEPDLHRIHTSRLIAV